MRIPSGTTDQYIYFVAVDSTDYASRETGLSSFTVYRSRNGAAAAVMTTPTINETDATNMPGVYELLLDEDMTIGSGNDSEEMVFHITATGMAPVTRTIELYRPKITAGNTLDVTTTGAAGIDWGNVENQSTSVDLSATATNLVDTCTTNTDMRGTDNALLAASAPTNFSDLAITVTTGKVTVGTNDDKTGYSISGTKTTLDALNDIAATSIVSAGAITTLAGAVVNVDTVDTCTTNSDMRGTDSAALASVCTEARLAELDAANLPTDIATVDTVVDGIQTDLDNATDGLGAIKGAVDGLNDLSAAQVNAEVVDALTTDTYAEPGQGAPAATASLKDKIGYLYKAWRNKTEQTSSTLSLYDDAGTTVDQKATVADNGTTASRSEIVTGP